MKKIPSIYRKKVRMEFSFSNSLQHLEMRFNYSNQNLMRTSQKSLFDQLSRERSSFSISATSAYVHILPCQSHAVVIRLERIQSVARAAERDEDLSRTHYNYRPFFSGLFVRVWRVHSMPSRVPLVVRRKDGRKSAIQ